MPTMIQLTHTLNPYQVKLDSISIATKIWAKYKSKFNCGTIPTVEFSIKSSTQVGYASYISTSHDSHKITLNLGYLCINDFDLKVQVISHELAHIVQFRCFPTASQCHGPEFRFILNSFGFPDTRFISVRKAPTKESNARIKALDMPLLETL